MARPPRVTVFKNFQRATWLKSLGHLRLLSFLSFFFESLSLSCHSHLLSRRVASFTRARERGGSLGQEKERPFSFLAQRWRRRVGDNGGSL